MPQPRKEQVTNPKTKFSIFRGNGTVFLSGGPVQNITNTVLDNNYDFFVDNSISKSVGGAETNSPAILYGGFGPFNITAGSSANLIINGVNGGNPITILIQVSDIITISGSPVLTTSKLANRINTILSGYGVVVPVALNINGQVVLKSAIGSNYSLGDDAYISLGDVTPNFLSLTGFGSGFTEDYGVTAPKLGIITKSTDGRGGVVQLKKNDGSTCEVVNNNMLHVGRFVYVPEYQSGGQISARLRAFPGPDVNGKKIELTYERQTLLSPKIVTYNSNFPALSGQTLTLSFNLDMTSQNNPEDYNFPYTSFGVPVTFGSITSASDVVDAINNSYWGGVYFSVGTPQRAAVIFKSSEPYSFESTDTFRIRLNGNATIELTPSISYPQATAGQLAVYINNRISFVGQSGQGEAYVVALPNGLQTVAIRSLVTFNSNSVEILPSLTAGYEFDLLNKFGVTPGLYKPSRIARLYGNDEIVIEPPFGGPATTMTLNCSTFVRDALGVSSTSITLNAAPGIQEVPIPSSYGAIPEILEFDQEPDNYDSIIQDFNKISEKPNLSPFDGIKNIVDSVLLDKNGKVDQNFIPRILSFLALGSLKLNQTNFRRTVSDTTTRSKIDVPQSTLEGYVLLFETYVQNSSNKVRVYLNGSNVYLTYNAYCDQNGLNWTVDSNTVSYMVEINNFETLEFKRKPYITSTFTYSGWVNVLELNSSLTDSIVKLINKDTLSSLLEFKTTEEIHEIIRLGEDSCPPFRLYKRGGPSNSIMITYDAFYDHVTNLWNKDSGDENFYTFKIEVDSERIIFSARYDDSSWNSSSWDDTLTYSFTNLTYPQLNLMNSHIKKRNRGYFEEDLFLQADSNDTGTELKVYTGFYGLTQTVNATYNEGLDKWTKVYDGNDAYYLSHDPEGLNLFRREADSDWDNSGINSWEERITLTSRGLKYKSGGVYIVPITSFIEFPNFTQWTMTSTSSRIFWRQNNPGNNPLRSHICLPQEAYRIISVKLFLNGQSLTLNKVGFEIRLYDKVNGTLINSYEHLDSTSSGAYIASHEWTHTFSTPIDIKNVSVYLGILGEEENTGAEFYGAEIIYDV